MGKLRRVLVCDDDAQIRRALIVLLRGGCFEPVAVGTVRDALDVARFHSLSAATVDLLLPDGGGVELCRRLREWSDMPILAISAIGEEEMKVQALEAGADDYITKPFAPGELIARLRAILRRTEPVRAESVVAMDGLEVDLAAHAVRREGKEVSLTPTEFQLLHVLVRNRGRLMTHRALLSEVWGSAYEHDKQTLQSHVANLRRKIDPHPNRRRYIQTDFGVGYRFIAQ
jgi:two-component system KDP operon response regulator KdpE